MEHAKYWNPSGSSTWVHCNGAPIFCENYPNEDSPETIEGRVAHEYCCAMLRNEPLPNGITQEMIDLLPDYINSIQLPYSNNHHEEQRLAIPTIHQECFGTCDHYCYDSVSDTLYIDELKWGRVLVLDWWQHICYFAGIFVLLMLKPETNVIFRTFQPRAYHPEGTIRKWIGKAHELFEKVSQLHNAANNPDPKLSSGSHCRYCPGMLACPANIEAAQNAIDVSNMPLNKQQVNPGRELDLLKSAFERIKNRLSSCEAEIAGIIRNGGIVPGWSLITGKPGNSKWSKPDKEILQYSKMCGVNIATEKLLTPIQAIKKGMPEILVASISERTSPAIVLTKTDPEKVAKYFNNGEL